MESPRTAPKWLMTPTATIAAGVGARQAQFSMSLPFEGCVAPPPALWSGTAKSRESPRPQVPP
jgi:hypothetical protein